MLIDIIIILCWLVVIGLMGFAGFHFIKISKDKSKPIRIYLICIGIFFTFYCINRIIFFLHELLFDPFMWSMTLQEYGATMNPDSPLFDLIKFNRYDLLWRVSTGIGSAGLLIFLIGFESQILEKRSFFIFSIIQGATLVLSLILGASGDQLNIGRYILYFGLLPALSVPIIYFILGIKAFGAARKRAIGAGLGFLIFYLGISANSSAGKSIFNFLWGLTGLQLTYIIYGVFVTIGLLIYMKSIKY